MSFVLDSSMALSWCFRDEQTPQSLAVLQAAATSLMVVPALWHLEIANVLGLAVRKRRLDLTDLAAILNMLDHLDIHTDPVVPKIESAPLLPLMQAHSLTAYDAVYLDLALRLNLPLATLDTELAAAAQTEGVTLFRNTA